MTSDKFKELMAVDKKVLDGALRLILLKGPLGNCTFTADFDAQALEQTLQAFCRTWCQCLWVMSFSSTLSGGRHVFAMKLNAWKASALWTISAHSRLSDASASHVVEHWGLLQSWSKFWWPAQCWPCHAMQCNDVANVCFWETRRPWVFCVACPSRARDCHNLRWKWK